MKIVINKCFGGFSLSPKAIKRMAELQGRECYFFENDFKTDKYIPLPFEKTEKRRFLFFQAFDIPNPNEVLKAGKMTEKEKKEHNELYEKHSLERYPDDRTNPFLIKVVEDLGDEASESCAELKIVEIPDGIEWEIDDYDGMETIHEKHRSWG